MTIVPALQPGMKAELCLPPGNSRLRTHIIQIWSVCTIHCSVVVGSFASYLRVTVPNQDWDFQKPDWSLWWFFQCHKVKDCTVIHNVGHNFSPAFLLFPTNYVTVDTVPLSQLKNKTTKTLKLWYSAMGNLKSSLSRTWLRGQVYFGVPSTSKTQQ